MTKDEIHQRFSYNDNLTKEQVDAIKKVRKAYEELALLLNDALPDSRAKSVALTDLETSSHWAISSIAKVFIVPE